MTQTPLQELIARFEKIGNKETDETKKWIWSAASEHLKLSLPKEREFVNKVWNAGATSGYDNKRVHGTCEWDKEGHAANFIDFINELYPKS